MGYKFYFYINDNLYFQADILCNQCQGTSKNGNRCRRRVCIASPYCFQHLASIKKLKVKKSNIENSGKGLFAWDSKNTGRIFKGPRNTKLSIIPGEKIVEYSGELIDLDTLIQRYSDYTAPYGIEINENLYEDASLIRGTGAMANHSKRNNARFDISRNRVILRATKGIKHNQEILVNYGSDYRFDEDSSYQTKYKR